MAHRKLGTLIGSICLILVLAAMPFMAACPAPPAEEEPTLPEEEEPTPPPPPTKPIILRAVGSLKLGHPQNYPLIWLAEQAEKRSNGELIIDIMGGAETIPTYDQAEALTRGVVDILAPGSGFVQAVWPEAIVFPLSRITPTQERQQGALALLQESSKKVGMYYLGRTVWPRGYYMFVNVPVESPDDLANLKIRGAPIYARFLTALGVSMVSVPFADVYTAVERGLIDGYCWPPSICDYGLEEVTKYMINHIYYAGNMGILVNLETWNQLPKHLQELLNELVEEQETGLEQMWRDQMKKELETIAASGVEFIEFSPADAKWYVDLAFDEAWKEVVEKSPEYGTRLREIMCPED